MQDIGCEIPWMTFARVDSIKSDVADRLRETNCLSVQIGFESFDNDVLRAMNKRVTVEQYRDAISRLADAGINTRACFIMGHSGETHTSVARTLEVLDSIEYEGDGTFDFLFAPFILFPLSPAYTPEYRKEYNLTGHMHTWRHETMKSGDIDDLLRKAFLSIRDNVFYAYTKDDIMPDLPPDVLRNLKQRRQRARQHQVFAGEGSLYAGMMFQKEMSELEKLLLPYVGTEKRRAICV